MVKIVKLKRVRGEVAPEFLAFRTKGKIGVLGRAIDNFNFSEINCTADDSVMREGITADKRSSKSIMRAGNGNSMLVD